MIRLVLQLLFLSALLCVVVADRPLKYHNSGPLSIPSPDDEGKPTRQVANPVLPAMPPQKTADTVHTAYATGEDFIGSFHGVPVNPTAHLQASLADDKQYLASVIRAPLDLGDIASCKHSDLVRDARELKKVALRLNHRRINLAQLQHWTDHASDALQKIETEISSTTDTAKNLAEQLDALTAQKSDIVSHVQRSIHLRELDRTSRTLMRLKNARLDEEVKLQSLHNERVMKNFEHNKVLAKLHDMRTKQGLAIGKLHDPRPYRFAQVDMEEGSEAETEQEGENESEAETAATTEADSNAEAEMESEGKVESEGEAESEGESESEAEAEAPVTEAESEAAPAAEAEAESTSADGQ